MACYKLHNIIMISCVHISNNMSVYIFLYDATKPSSVRFYLAPVCLFVMSVSSHVSNVLSGFTDGGGEWNKQQSIAQHVQGTKSLVLFERLCMLA